MRNFDNYFKERDFKLSQKMKEILAELPYFCEEFFRGIENRTN